MFFLLLFGWGRVLFFAVWAWGVFLFFAVWAGDGSSLTYQPAWLGVEGLPTTKTKQQKKTRVPKVVEGVILEIDGLHKELNNPHMGIQQKGVATL